MIDKDDKGEINLEQLDNFILQNNLNNELFFIKKVLEENSDILKL